MRHWRRARRMRGMPLRLLLAVVAILLIPAATASADSIVFVKDSNVWVASPDGSNQRQLTRDGTSDHPYRSPSQADDGTVAASYLDSIRLIRRDGTRLRELDPPPLTNSVSHAMDGTPVDVALSPDAKTIAYTFVSASCPVGASCGARAATGYITSRRPGAARQPLPQQPELGGQRTHAGVRRLPAPGQHARPGRRRGRPLVRRLRDRRPARRDRPRRRRAQHPGRQARAGAQLRQRHPHHVVHDERLGAADAAVRDRQARGPLRPDVGARRPVAGLGRAGRRLGQAERARLHGAAVARDPRRHGARLGSRRTPARPPSRS